MKTIKGAKQLRVPPSRATSGMTWRREDGALFTYKNQEWVRVDAK